MVWHRLIPICAVAPSLVDDRTISIFCEECWRSLTNSQSDRPIFQHLPCSHRSLTGSSKEENENEIQTSFDPKNIYDDQTGNLRFGIVMNDIVEEMRQMIGNDGIQEGLTTDVVYYRFFVALSMVIFRFA
jgi:hypothetical protein